MDHHEGMQPFTMAISPSPDRHSRSHAAFQEVIRRSDHYKDVVAVFGMKSSQAKKALKAYLMQYEQWQREHHWDQQCAIEPSMLECRLYDVWSWFTFATSSMDSTMSNGWSCPWLSKSKKTLNKKAESSTGANGNSVWLLGIRDAARRRLWAFREFRAPYT